jgi:hypothetical protein
MKSIVINGIKYEVATPTIVTVPNFFEILAEDAKSIPQMLIAYCVSADGKPVGEEGLKELPIGVIARLTPVVMEAAGFSEAAKAGE